MPFAGFSDFSACILHMKEKEGYSEEVAKKVCGKLQATVEHANIEEFDLGLAVELQCRMADLPKEAFAYSDDAGGHLPHHGMDGKIKCNCVRAAIQAIGGARTGKPMTGVPDSAMSHLKSHAKECGIETGQSGEVKLHPDKESAMLAFSNKGIDFTDDPTTGDIVFHNVTLLAEGTWTDKHSKKTIHYSASELVKMKMERKTIKMMHDIYSQLPITNEIGVIENEKYVVSPNPRWKGDVRIFPTQNWKDVATLLKRKQITNISSELFHNPIPDDKGQLNSTDIIFMGAATVRQGACSLCTFNEGDEITTGEGTGGTGDPAISALEKQLQDAVQNKSSDVAVLTAQLEEVKKIKTNQAIAELEASKAKITELEKDNKELIKKFAEMENSSKVKDLQRQITELAKQPVIHTRITGKSTGTATELDSGDFPFVSSKDME